MKQADFLYYLKGFLENKQSLTKEEVALIKAKLQETFTEKVTPDRLTGFSITDINKDPKTQTFC